MPAPFLTAQFGSSSVIAVEVAWGADLTAAASTWAWTDVTADVRHDAGISLKHGRSDEAATTQPASCELVLDNSAGHYSLGGQSPYWPNVRQNTPVRVRIDIGDGAGWRTRFRGYADSWTPAWDQSANVATVALTASGILRRLQQHVSPIVSSLRRRLSNESNVVGYWPLEEGSNSTEGLSHFPNHSPMAVLGGEVNFAADTSSFPSTVQMPTLKNGKLVGVVPRYTGTGAHQVRMLTAWPDTDIGDNRIIARVYMNSPTLSFVDVIHNLGGAFTVRGYSDTSAGTTMVFSNGPALVGPGGTTIFGHDVRLFMEFAQNGANVDYGIGFQSITTPSGNLLTGSVAATMGNVSRVEVGPGLNVDGVSVGQVVVQNAKTSIFSDYKDLTAFAGDSAYQRFTRLCAENGITATGYGDGVSGSTTSQANLMGPQRPASLLSLLRDAEAVSDGIIYEGTNEADLVIWLRQARENGAVSLSIPAGELAAPLRPAYDDQGRINRMETTRQDGGAYTAEDATGPLGTAAVGIYDASETLAVELDEQLADQAHWSVAKGTYDGYRHPEISLNLAATPGQAAEWLSVTGPGRRLSVTDVTAQISQYPTPTIDLEIQGYQQTLSPYRWEVTVNCAPYYPWRVIRLAADTGDTNTHLGRLDTDGSTLTAARAAGATSLSVTIPSGPLWTTTADDFPLTVEVGGTVVTVTAISGTASPQTFTVAALPRAIAAGAPIRVHNPAVLGM